MMKFLSRSANALTASDEAGHDRNVGPAVSYESVITTSSKVMPGVVFRINRISFGRRMELCRSIREITRRVEFLEAGSELNEKIEASLLAHEIDAMYLRWGLVGIEGLMIDGAVAASDQLIEKGPEELSREIVDAIKDQCGLGDEERKN